VVTAVTLTSGGSGYNYYQGEPVCTLTGGGGTGAKCAAYSCSNGEVCYVYLTNFGRGYTSAPTCTITRGYGGGATCTASVGPGISVTLTAHGSGYTTLPQCTLSGGGGTGGECAALATDTSNAYEPAYRATTGWDFATGIGTVNATNLVSAMVSSHATLSSSSLPFSSQDVNTTSAAQSVTVTNTGTSPLAMLPVTISGTNSSDFAKTADTCSKARLAAKGACKVSVKFTPSAPGARTAALILTDIAPNSPQKVSLTGTGVAPTLTLSPASASIVLGGTQLFTATISNATNTSLRWYVNGFLNGNTAQGTLNGCTTSAPLTCTYKAPPVDVPSPNPAVIEVVSVEDPSVSKAADVTVTDSIAVTLSPPAATLDLGDTQVFTATITGTTSTTLDWYVNGVQKGNAAQGTLSACTTSAPLTCTYTAPTGEVPSPNPAAIKVASAADPSKYKTASVTVNTP
jgi:hypothetical protein